MGVEGEDGVVYNLVQRKGWNRGFPGFNRVTIHRQLLNLGRWRLECVRIPCTYLYEQTFGLVEISIKLDLLNSQVQNGNGLLKVKVENENSMTSDQRPCPARISFHFVFLADFSL